MMSGDLKNGWNAASLSGQLRCTMLQNGHLGIKYVTYMTSRLTLIVIMYSTVEKNKTGLNLSFMVEFTNDLTNFTFQHL